jgi:8-hydroxy-5-deazaflavin:NADPH oxidoreductase
LTPRPCHGAASEIVVDANHYRDGKVAALDNDETTSSELLAAHLPPSTVVKAFNTAHYATLASGGDTAKPRDEGGRRQQPGSPVYAANMTAAQACQALA